MQYIASKEEMQQIDAYNIKELGIPGIVLMERASLALADEIVRHFPEACRILVVTERGNNGGDGLAAGRILMARGYSLAFYEIGALPAASESYQTQRKILERLNAVFLEELPEDDPDVWIDAIFGVGLSREITGIHKRIIKEINKRKGFVVAVDVPSGIDATDGRIWGAAVEADMTVTFGLAKRGLILYPGADYAGEICVKDIGFMPESVSAIGPRAVTYTREDLSGLPARKAWSNKGTYGKVLLIAGSKNMAGAALLAGRAACRAGAGLVRVLSHESNREILQTGLPDAIFSPLDTLEEAVRWADIIGIGPGIGQSEEAGTCLKKILSMGRVPLVIDADGINLLACMLREDQDIRTQYGEYPYGIILTPHPGEMARLTGRSTAEIIAGLIPSALAEADEKHVIVLKDAHTVVAGGDLEVYINMSGNHGMAAGGSGDVLTGLICGLLAQYEKCEDVGKATVKMSIGERLVRSARLGVFCHGLAGDLAAAASGQRGLMASDLPDAIARVLEGFGSPQPGSL